MSDLLWFDGITLQTPINRIGWFYVLTLVLAGTVIYQIRSLIRMFRGKIAAPGDQTGGQRGAS